MVSASGVRVRSCLVPGCSSRAVARGLCKRHYDRSRVTGRPTKDVVLRECMACGQRFEAGRSDKVFCSGRCRMRWMRWRRREGIEPGMPADVVAFNQPPVGGVPLESFTVGDVWAKSPGVCPLCGLPLDRSLPPWDAMAGVPDWIVPPEDGGALTLENRTIVHRSCWGRKALRG